MDKSKIPTHLFTLPSGKEVEIYDWLTQSEAEEHTNILIGDIPVTTLALIAEGQADLEITGATALKARRYLATVMLKNVTFDEFDVLSPSDRDALIEELEGVVNNTKKKVSQ